MIFNALFSICILGWCPLRSSVTRNATATLSDCVPHTGSRWFLRLSFYGSLAANNCTSHQPHHGNSTPSPTVVHHESNATTSCRHNNQRVSYVDLLYEGEVANDGLQFSRFRFSPQISVKGPNSILYHRNFLYVTHYSGGMDQRHVRLSRKRMGDTNSSWVTIVFPHQHVLFRRDKTLPEMKRRGDSHNIISLGISPEDSTMHLLYDMHAYTPSDFPNSYFNYQVSVPGGALVADEEFTEDLFGPKQNVLSSAVDPTAYYNVSYPAFLLSPNNKLLATWRTGGSTNAKMKISTYENGSWGSPVPWNANPNPTGIYGQFKSFNGRMFMSWQRRMQSDNVEGYELNRGIYFASSDVEGVWHTDSGKAITTPITDLEAFKLGEPSHPGERMTNAGGSMLSYVVAENGAFHVHSRVDGRERHCFRAENATFKCSVEKVAWTSLSMHVVGNQIYRVGLQNNEPVLQRAKAGTDNWSEAYKGTVNCLKFSHGVSALVGNHTILFSLMELNRQEVDVRPIHVLRFVLSPKS